MTDPQNNKVVDKKEDKDLEEKAFKELDTTKVTKQTTPDVEKIAQEKAEKIATAEVDKRMKDLGKRISGEETQPQYSWEKRGEENPKDWREATGEMERIADEKAEAKLKGWKAEEKAKQEKSQKMTQDQERLWSRISSDSYWELEKKGLVPSPSDEVRKKARANIQLTREEMQNDPGMQAFNEIRVASRQKGKSFKEYVYEDYKKQPKGATAPVLGGAGSFQSGDVDYTYKDVQADGKSV